MWSHLSICKIGTRDWKSLKRKYYPDAIILDGRNFPNRILLSLRPQVRGKKKRLNKKETILSSDKECHEHQRETGEAVAAFRLEVRSQGEGQGHCRSVEPLECSADILHWRRWARRGSQTSKWMICGKSMWCNTQLELENGSRWRCSERELFKTGSRQNTWCHCLCRALSRRNYIHEAQHKLKVPSQCFWSTRLLW